MHIQPTNGDPSLEQLVSIALEQLERRGFADKSIKYYRNAWTNFIEFVASLTPAPLRVSEIDRLYLDSCGIEPNANRSDLSWSQDVARRALRILREIQETGQFKSHDRSSVYLSTPAKFQPLQKQYEDFCQHHLAHRSSTVAAHRHILKHFFTFLAKEKLASFHCLEPKLLNRYIACRSDRVNSNSLATEVSCIRSFLRFLCMEGIADSQILMHARTLRFPTEHRLAPIWSADTLESILLSVDRTTKVGKRDFAILLLASRLGLRASDIRSMKIEDIQWQQDQITIRQCKTGTPLSLPLGEEVGQALIDYLSHARPASAHREIFLKVRAPFDPVACTNPFYSVISAALKRAKISVPAGKARGLHSLRHTLATQLVLNNQPLESVAAVLGHGSIESTRLYTHLDCDALGSVAIDPEQVFS